MPQYCRDCKIEFDGGDNPNKCARDYWINYWYYCFTPGADGECMTCKAVQGDHFKHPNGNFYCRIADSRCCVCLQREGIQDKACKTCLGRGALADPKAYEKTGMMNWWKCKNCSQKMKAHHGRDDLCSIPPEPALVSTPKPAAQAAAKAQAGSGSAAQGLAALSLEPGPRPGAAAEPPRQGNGGGRTLAGSNFRAAYQHAEATEDDFSLLSVMKEFLKEYCKLRRLSPEQGTLLLTAVRMEANDKSKDWFMEGLTDVTGMAQRLWSSTCRGCPNIELCTIINDALRTDEPALMRPLAIFTRTINAGLINRRNVRGTLPWPPSNQTHRGAVLPPKHLDWYKIMLKRKFRVPGFLATSFSQDIAEKFAMWAWEALDGKEPAVLYTIKLDPRGATNEVRRCKHVSLIRKSNVETECEFLYVPYSTFTVSEVHVSTNPTYLDPHVIVLESSIDNRVEPEDLPLAPWY